MKIEIWDEEQKEEEQPLRLRLVYEDNGSVSLTIVNEEGVRVECGDILQIDTAGYIHRNECVAECFDLQLDDQGKIKLGNPI
jgi:hypothetical protein